MIDRIEFMKVMGYIATVIGKPMAETREAAAARMEVYYDLLGDLPLDVLQNAAKRVVLTHKWATFPSVAELREAAVMLQTDRQLTAPVAFAIACRAAGRIDPSIQGEYVVISGGRKVVYESMTAYAMEGVPEQVAVAMRVFGMERLLSGSEPMGVLQAQFCRTYDGLMESAKQVALLPSPLRNDIEAIKQRVAQIGRLPDDVRQVQEADPRGVGGQQKAALR